MFTKSLAAICTVAGVLAAPAAGASVILLGEAEVNPAGIGTVTTLLNLQSQGNATDETGRVYWDGTRSVATALPNPAGAAQPGAETTIITGGNNNQTRLFSDIGVTSASDLRVFFNINEPSPADSVLLNSLIFTAYDPSGSIVFTASLAAPLTLTETGAGIGTSDYVFGLDAAQAELLQAVFAPTLRLGVEASISGAQGGLESFFAGRAGMVPPGSGGGDTPGSGGGETPGSGGGEVSEPLTLGLLSVGLIGLALVRRRRA